MIRIPLIGTLGGLAIGHSLPRPVEQYLTGATASADTGLLYDAMFFRATKRNVNLGVSNTVIVLALATAEAH
jgi:hypothetical protein